MTAKKTLQWVGTEGFWEKPVANINIDVLVCTWFEP